MLPLTLLFAAPAHAGDFIDVWVTSAFEDTNVRAGPEAFSPSANFVERGNRTFFEDYESRTTDDISRSELCLYRRDDGYVKGWSTEAAFVLRLTPYLDPDRSDPGTQIEDDGSYVRIVRELPGKDHNVSLTGYALDAGRFRLGYSYDLTWGGKEIHSFTTGAAPGVRLQWQRHGSYAFLGAKTAVGNYTDPDTADVRNQAFYGLLGGAGVRVGDNFKVEGGVGSFQQGQILNVQETTSPLYGELIIASGLAGQVAWRSTSDLKFVQSADLVLYRNSPDFVKDSYVSHQQLDGVGVIVQSEVDRLSHNLLSATADDETVIEHALAGDLQTMLVIHSTTVSVDLVYKDLPYILFNVPGLTSGVAMNPDMETTAQLYGRFKVEHYFPNAHVAPAFGIGVMQPATYKTSEGTFVQYTERDKEQVPTKQEPAAILSSVAAVQYDFSKSMVGVGEILYTVDNNQSEFVQSTEDSLVGERVAAPDNRRQILGFNLMLRARF